MNSPSSTDSRPRLNFILKLPDEILVHVLQYLTTEDLLNISQTCNRLSRVVSERRVIRYVYLKSAYTCTSSVFKMFFQPMLRCLNIEVLDLTSCYWLSAIEIYNCIKKLKELHSLYVADTKFTFSHLQDLFSSITVSKLRRVAITAYYDTFEIPRSSTVVSAHLSALKFLYVWFHKPVVPFEARPQKDLLRYLYEWLRKCTALEELWVISRGREYLQTDSIDLPECVLDLPLLRSLVVNVQCDFIDVFVDILVPPEKRSTIQWRKWWVNDENNHHPVPFDSVFLSRDCTLGSDFFAMVPHGNYPHFTHLMRNCNGTDIDEEINTLFPKLKYVCLHGCSVPCDWWEQHVQIETCCIYTPIVFVDPGLSSYLINISKLSNLRSLALVTESVISGHPTQAAMCNVLDAIIKGCPLMNEVVLVFSRYKVRFKDSETATKSPSILHLLCGWTKLTKLHLINVQVEVADLIKVAESCPNIEDVNLTCSFGFNLTGQAVHQLCKALSLWENLKDFRLEQDYIDTRLYTTLWKTLRTRLALERVAVIDDKTCKPLGFLDARHIFHMLRTSSKLVLFFFRCQSLTDVWIKNMVQNLKQLLNERPALRVMFMKNVVSASNLQLVKKMPYIHSKEMVNSIDMNAIKMMLLDAHFEDLKHCHAEFGS